MSEWQVKWDPELALEIDEKGFWTNPDIKNFPDFSELAFEQAEYWRVMNELNARIEKGGVEIGRQAVEDKELMTWKTVGDVRAYFVHEAMRNAYVVQVHRWPELKGHSVVYFACQVPLHEDVTS